MKKKKNEDDCRFAVKKAGFARGKGGTQRTAQKYSLVVDDGNGGKKGTVRALHAVNTKDSEEEICWGHRGGWGLVARKVLGFKGKTRRKKVSSEKATEWPQYGVQNKKERASQGLSNKSEVKKKART